MSNKMYSLLNSETGWVAVHTIEMSKAPFDWKIIPVDTVCYNVQYLYMGEVFCTITEGTKQRMTGKVRMEQTRALHAALTEKIGKEEADYWRSEPEYCNMVGGARYEAGIYRREMFVTEDMALALASAEATYAEGLNDSVDHFVGLLHATGVTFDAGHYGLICEGCFVSFKTVQMAYDLEADIEVSANRMHYLEV